MGNRLWHRLAAGVAAAALAAATSALFGGVAIAHEDGGSHGKHDNVGGDGGSGGKANVNCLIPIGISLGIDGQGDSVDQCNAKGGSGGDGGTGADY